MTNENSPSDMPTSAKSATKRSPAAGLALLLSLIALIGLSYLWYAFRYQTHILGINVAARLQTEDQTQVALATRLSALAASQNHSNAALTTLQNNLRAIQRLTTTATGPWRLRQAQELLLDANDQLRFEHNVPLALSALRAADRELRRQQNPRLIPVRAAIAREILKLQAIRHVHISTIALSLIADAKIVDQLPLALPAQFPPAPSHSVTTHPRSFWLRATHGVWHDFVSLIRIRKNVAHTRPLLPPQQAYFLRENLKLQLYTAELALLEHNPRVMGANVAAAHQWLTRYFDPQAPAVQALQRRLIQLEQQVTVLRWPDISGSLQRLRQLQQNAS